MCVLNRLIAASCVLAAFGLVLASCGGPASPSAPGVTVMRGVVFDESASASARSTGGATSSAAGNVTVTVQEDPSITTTVAHDGTFTLTGLEQLSNALEVPFRIGHADHGAGAPDPQEAERGRGHD